MAVIPLIIFSLFSLLERYVSLNMLATRRTGYGSRGKVIIAMTKEEDLRASIKTALEVTDPNNKGVSFELDEGILSSLKSKRPYLSIITERLFQSLDDYQISSKTKAFATNFVGPLSNFRKDKEKIVILGSGWGAHSFLKSIDSTKYDVKVISPRNYFTFTPMLAASAVGTVEFKSLCEPIRNTNPLVEYFEGSADDIDLVNKKVVCQSLICQGTACDMMDFEVEYDHLIFAVGATTNTFGIKGVKDNCQFLKQIEDAAKIRRAITYCFERANIPGLSVEEIRSTLSFVVVGAGPTGVEFTSELRDWIEREGKKYFGKVLKYVQITLVEAGGVVLPVFDEELQKQALKDLTGRETELISQGYIEKEMTTVRLLSGVREVGEKIIELNNGDKIPYGFCVWAAGNGPNPLVLTFVDKVKDQKDLQGKARGRIVTDSWLRVKGLENAGVYSIGDCTFMEDTPLPATAQVASQQGAYLGRLFSKGFFSKQNPSELQRATRVNADAEKVNVVSPPPPYRLAFEASNAENGGSDEIEFISDKWGLGQLGLPSSASTRKLDVDAVVDQDKSLLYAKPFQFLNLGVLAYIGASRALAQVSVDDKIILGTGPIGFLLWRGIYWFKQVSWRNRLSIAIDWVKNRAFGRDIGSS